MENEALKEFTESGTFHSSGSFSISPSKALEKLGSFSLPEPEAWTLYIAQMAHLSKAVRCSFHQDRDGKLQVTFECQYPLDLTKILDGMVQGSIQGGVEGQLLNLCRVVVARKWSLQLLVSGRDSAKQTLRVSPTELGVEGQPVEVEGDHTLTFNLDRPPLSSAEKTYLQEKTRYSFTVITIEGKRHEQLDRLPNGVSLRLARDSRVAPGAYIQWVRNGCIVETETVARLKGMVYEYFCPADELETDLSGFSIRESADRTLLLRQARGDLRRRALEEKVKFSYVLKKKPVTDNWGKILIILSVNIFVAYGCLRAIMFEHGVLRGIREVFETLTVSGMPSFSLFFKTAGTMFLLFLIFLITWIPTAAFVSGIMATVFDFPSLNIMELREWFRGKGRPDRVRHDDAQRVALAAS